MGKDARESKEQGEVHRNRNPGGTEASEYDARSPRWRDWRPPARRARRTPPDAGLLSGRSVTRLTTERQRKTDDAWGDNRLEAARARRARHRTRRPAHHPPALHRHLRHSAANGQ